MNAFRRFGLAYRALRQFGPAPLSHYLFYKLGLHSGYLRIRTPPQRDPWMHGISLSARQRKRYRLRAVLELPKTSELFQSIGERGASLAEADRIVAGHITLFGHAEIPLDLAPAAGLYHWTEFERGVRPWGAEDVKWVWEPARGRWAFQLGRAYYLSGLSRYTRAFWQHTERFLDSNPPYRGPHWASAQEVALRLVAFTFAFHTIADDEESGPERLLRLGWAIASHAGRIPPTLAYARAQNNNHLITEAMGLYTAGLVLPDHPQARRWRALGWRWFHRAIQTQVAEDGTYVQQSMNYHRLLLQAALWMAALARAAGDLFPESSTRRLAAATRWARSMTDGENGLAPNLGPNDGALILPLGELGHQDHRPTLQAAAQFFTGAAALPPGPWDELEMWLSAPGDQPQVLRSARTAAGPSGPCCILRNPASKSWAYLRVPEFTDRPGHADVLHLDLWWRGLNVALDPGTFSYNAAPPWENVLARTPAHNTVTVAGQDQMTRAGKFLWLDWAKSNVLARDESPDGHLTRLTAAHDGYRRFGITHRRTVTACPDGRWEIEDLLEGSGSAGKPAAAHPPVPLRLHWLLPDWPHEIHNNQAAAEIRLQAPHGWVGLKVEVQPEVQAKAGLYQAGQHVWGTERLPDPIRGWSAPFYGHKATALSLSLQVAEALPILFKSEWTLG